MRWEDFSNSKTPSLSHWAGNPDLVPRAFVDDAVAGGVQDRWICSERRAVILEILTICVYDFLTRKLLTFRALWQLLDWGRPSAVLKQTAMTCAPASPSIRI